MKQSIFWFRRDLRIEDNIGLNAALKGRFPVRVVFIFDEQILKELPNDDPRVQFIHQQLSKIHKELKAKDSALEVYHGNPLDIWNELLKNHEIAEVYTNNDYEPYAVQRDESIAKLCAEYQVNFKSYKDQVVFEKKEVTKDDQSPYTVYTPYKRKWLQQLDAEGLPDSISPNLDRCIKKQFRFPSLEQIGFKPSTIHVPDFDLSIVPNYEETRNFPAIKGTSFLSTHLRFGTVSIRQLVTYALSTNATFLSELIWREFFMQIIYHFPQVVTQNFRRKYDGIQWRNDPDEFEKWCTGTTGYPLVDAGMRELNKTGLMHNRVRMVTAGFLCKHLLIDWRWGEAYFARKLLDFDLSANNGNWQWAAGTGCDAAPYFRIFNPTEQLKKFDADLKYTNYWVPEFQNLSYSLPIVEHKFARKRALQVYKEGIVQ